MSKDNVVSVRELIDSTDSFFNTVTKMNCRSIFLLVDFAVMTSIVLFSSTHRNASASITLLIIGVGIAMNLFNIDSSYRDSDEFKALSDTFEHNYTQASLHTSISFTDYVVSEDLKNLSNASQRYITKYKIVNIVNNVTLILVAILVCAILSSTTII